MWETQRFEGCSLSKTWDVSRPASPTLWGRSAVEKFPASRSPIASEHLTHSMKREGSPIASEHLTQPEGPSWLRSKLVDHVRHYPISFEMLRGEPPRSCSTPARHQQQLPNGKIAGIFGSPSSHELLAQTSKRLHRRRSKGSVGAEEVQLNARSPRTDNERSPDPTYQDHSYPSPSGPSVRDNRDINEPPMITDEHIVEFITDVEGNWEYLINFVSQSKILDWIGGPRGVWGPGELAIHRNGILVFGGDAPDKGPGDIRIIKILTKLKLEYPSQVFIILGNRDLMKMRFLAELDEVDENLDDPWLPTWEKQPRTLSDFLEKEGLEKNWIGKLRWMLECNMGCQGGTFSTRKDELAHLYGTATDEDVLISYTESVNPASEDPWMLEFLRIGVIALVLGDTLFVHGGLQDESAGHVPGCSSKYNKVQDWATALNAWKDRELSEFEQIPYWTFDKHGKKTRGGAALIQYGTPGAGKQTVIYYNPFDNGNPVKRTEKVRKFLDESGIKCLITGHQPHGQTPTVVRHMDTGLLAITADTSRSDSKGSKVFNPLNNRGLAISIVRLQGDHVFIEGVSNDGEKHACKLNRRHPSKDAMPDALVGRQLISNAWVKTVVERNGEKMVIVALGEGFNVTVEAMRIQRACLNLRGEYREGGDFDVSFQKINPHELRRSTKKKDDSGFEALADASVVVQASYQNFDGVALKAFEEAQTYVFAFNGVLMDPETDVGQKIIDNINRLITNQKRAVFITNDSTMSRKSFLHKLTNEFDIDILQSVHSVATLKSQGTSSNATVEEKKDVLQRLCVITSAYTCAWYCKQHGKIKKPFVITHGTGLLEELKLAGIKHYFATVDEDGNPKKEFSEPASLAAIEGIVKQAPGVDAILVGWDHRLSALTVAVAENFIRWNEELYDETGGKEGGILPIITCSSDLDAMIGRTSADFLVPSFQNRKVRAMGNGMMANAVCQRTGMMHSHIPIDVGKPSQILQEHLRRDPKHGGLGVDFGRSVMVGDNLEADVKLANECGMKSLLVLSGVTCREMLEREEGTDRMPTWVIDSFANVYP
mmetsp:Transcript_30073/g.79207  ORF Transcript_30073/g.79207 Transcript_30073/m.79207 type:complete len:1054 (-) Transcript_30073:32-3193(-)